MKINRLHSQISLLIALIIIVLSVCSVFGASYIQDGDWKYEMPTSEQGVYYVAGYTGTADKIQIPALFQTKPVTKINNNTFLNKSNLTYVSIPATINYIGMNAFYGCSSLESVSIPANVSEIGPNAFYGCTSLYSLEFPGESALKEISHNLFSGCTALTEAVLPDGITSIGARAFINCSSLESVTIGPYVDTIDSTSFSGCTALTIYGWNDTYAQQYAADNNIPFVSLGDFSYPTEPTEPSVPSEPETGENTVTTETVTSSSDEPGTTPTVPSSESTEPDPTEPTTKFPEGDKYLIGDSDLSGIITVKDATLIQKYAAGLAQLDNIQRFLANCNGQGDVNVKDATQIQKFCAGFKNILFVGTEVII